MSKKFVMDMQYGISKSKSCLISEISRVLDEKINLKNTIERLCDNLVRLTEEQKSMIKNNYYKEIKKYFGEEPVAIFDDSDISKDMEKIEDLYRVIDASSSNKETVN